MKEIRETACRSFWQWVTSFDVIKALALAIVVMIGSWYDLKAEVRSISESILSHEKTDEKIVAKQEIIDARQDSKTDMQFATQDARMREYHLQLQEALKDIKAEIRSQRKAN